MKTGKGRALGIEESIKEMVKEQQKKEKGEEESEPTEIKREEVSVEANLPDKKV